MGVEAQLDDLLSSAHRAGVTPGSVSLVWRAGRVRWHRAHGVLATHPGSPGLGVPTRLDTVYDLASLTKVLATTRLIAAALTSQQVELRSQIPEELAVGSYRPQLKALLEHCSGLEAHREFFAPPWSLPPGANEGLIEALRRVPPAADPEVRTSYSDLGFILVGEWLERLHGAQLDTLFEDQVAIPLGVAAEIGFRRLGSGGGSGSTIELDRIAPTEVYDPGLHPQGAPSWHQIRAAVAQSVAHGVVHDDNCVVADGVAGHAGLFGSAPGVLALALEWLDRVTHSDPAQSWAGFTHSSEVTGSTRRLGFDGPDLEGGSTGGVLGRAAFGHLGFTGTSMWIDPDRQAIYVLLTNRVHPTRDTRGIVELRPAFHRLAARL